MQSKKDGEWPANVESPTETLHLIGAIIHLSLAGCSVRTVKPFTGDLLRQVEVEFEVRGLPFRIAGVKQERYDAHTVGVLFNQMSYRKREELAQLIEEIYEMYKVPTETQDAEPAADAS